MKAFTCFPPPGSVLLLVFSLAWFLPWSCEAAEKSPATRAKKQSNRTFAEARITVYWQNSDADTRALKSSSGVRLKNKQHVAVDPSLIPYGSEVRINGWGKFIAVDTGGAVKKRTAARRMGKNVPVVDVFFTSKAEALQAAQKNPAFAKVEVLPGRS
jgi:3D (Asp-Asp-Asp) domain-containing protein